MLTISTRIALSGQALHASRFAAVGQPAVAHIALANHAALWVVLRHAVGTIPRAVLAADAGLRAVLHDSGDWVLLIGLDRTADQARRLQTVIAAHREMKALRIGIQAAFDFSDPPPVNVGGISVLLVAGHDAALAADALRHIEMKAVLLAGLECPLGNQRRGGRRRDLVETIRGQRRQSTQNKGDAVFPCALQLEVKNSFSSGPLVMQETLLHKERVLRLPLSPHGRLRK